MKRGAKPSFLTCVVTRAKGVVVVAQLRWAGKDCVVLLWLLACADANVQHAMMNEPWWTAFKAGRGIAQVKLGRLLLC